MCNCSREWQVQRCCLGKFLPAFGWDVSSEGRNRGEEKALNLKLLPNSMILHNLSYPAAFNWAVLLNKVLCFSFAVWLWLFEFSSSLLLSVCLGSFPAPFSLLLALCSPACPPAHPTREPERSLLPCEMWQQDPSPSEHQNQHRLHQELSLCMAKEQLLHSLLQRFGRGSREW